MRDKEQFASLKLAPRARVTVAQLDKVDRPVEGRGPSVLFNSLQAIVNLDERSRLNQRMKHEIFQTDETVQTVPYVEGLDECDRHFSPHLDHSRQQVALVQTQAAVKPKWKRDRFVVIRVLEGCKVRVL